MLVSYSPRGALSISLKISFTRNIHESLDPSTHMGPDGGLDFLKITFHLEFQLHCKLPYTWPMLMGDIDFVLKPELREHCVAWILMVHLMWAQ